MGINLAAYAFFNSVVISLLLPVLNQYISLKIGICAVIVMIFLNYKRFQSGNRTPYALKNSTEHLSYTCYNLNVLDA